MTIALSILYYPSYTNFSWARASSYNILPLITIFNGSELFHSLHFWLLLLSQFSAILFLFYKDRQRCKTSYTTTFPTKLVSHQWVLHIFLFSDKKRNDFLWWRLILLYYVVFLNFYSLSIWYFFFSSHFFLSALCPFNKHLRMVYYFLY